NNQRISSNPRNRQIAQPGMHMGQDRQMQMVGGNSGNQFRQYVGQNAGNPAGRRDAAYLQTQSLIAQKEKAGIQLQAEEYDLMAAAADLDEIKETDQLRKFMGTVRFGNDHVAAILGFVIISGEIS
nr:hypothetical protein [Tanacetum cinerariifolium]